jgi:DNA-binding NarL/FixJ family response regulator
MTSMDAIRVAVVDDHPILREGTAALLASRPDVRIVGLGGSVEDAVRFLDATDRPDVLLLDIRLGDLSGLEVLAERRATPAGAARTAIVVWTAYDYPQYVDAAHRLGAAGFVLKTAPTSELFDAIRRAAAGGLAFGRRPSGDTATLSRREHEVVVLLVDGCSNDEIAQRLSIAPRTVESHLARLFERFGTRSRTELATRAVREGWLEVPASSR